MSLRPLHFERDAQKVIDKLAPLEKIGVLPQIRSIALAGALCDLKRYEEALAIVHRHPDDHRLGFMHLHILLATERFEEAEIVRQKAMDYAQKRLTQSGKDKAYWLNDLGRLESDLHRSIEYYKRCIEESYYHVYAHLNLASALASDQQFDEALKHARIAVELKPSYTVGPRLITMLKFAEECAHEVAKIDEQDFNRLVSSLEHHEEVSPDNRLLYSVHVCLLVRSGRFEEAEIVKQKVLDHALYKYAQPGEDKPYWFDRICFLDPKTQIEYYKKSLKEEPRNHVVNYKLALSLRDDGQIDEALNHARMAVELNPEYTDALDLVTLLEDVQRLQSETDTYFTGFNEVYENIVRREYQAVIDTVKLLEETGEVTKVDVRRLVDALYHLDRYEEALANIKRYPNNRLLDRYHLRILEKTGRLKEAYSVRLKALQFALERLEDAQPGREKASLFEEVGLLQPNLSRRIEYFKKSLQEYPQSYEVQGHLALALSQDGQFEDALKHARMAVDLNPEAASAIRLVKQLEDVQRDRETQSHPTDWSDEVYEAYLRADYQTVIEILGPLEQTGEVTKVDLRLLVRSLYYLDRYEDALAILKRHPNHLHLKHTHADILEATGRLKEADSVRVKALKSALERLKDAQPGREMAFFLNEVGLPETELNKRGQYFKESFYEYPLKYLEQFEDAMKHARMAVDPNPEAATAIRVVMQLKEEIDSRSTKTSRVRTFFRKSSMKLFHWRRKVH